MKIGLALGSGAARGWAHIGIIQALEEMGIKIDVVAGCSIGAYVGAAYSSNKLQPLADWATSLTDWQVLGLMGVGLRKGGLASGQKVFQALEDNFCEAQFEAMSKPFAVVATDLYSGKEVSFMQGPVGVAVRASCAIPALFPPISYEGRWLVDGAVVNPVPVNLCRQLGADFVFAVNLSADFRPQIEATFEAEHEENLERTNAFFSKSQSFVKQFFRSGDKKPIDQQEQQFAQSSTESTQNYAEQGNVEIEAENTSQQIVSQAQVEPNINSENEQQVASEQAQVKIESAPTKQKLKAVQHKTPTMLGVMSSSLDILQARVTRSRLAGDPPDVLIEPQLRNFGIMEFHRAEELIEEGRQSVRRVAEQIKYQLRLS